MWGDLSALWITHTYIVGGVCGIVLVGVVAWSLIGKSDD